MLIDLLIKSLEPFKLDIKVIADIGTRDLEQSIEFHSVYPKAKIYAIEANKESYEACKKIKPNYVTLIHGAAVDYDGEITFYAVKQEDNKGASSIFEPTDKVVGVNTVSGVTRTTVPAVRVDSVIKEKIDLVWCDTQGSEVTTLKGFGTKLDDVKVIAIEVATGQIYYPTKKYKPANYEELSKFMLANNFEEIHRDQPWAYETDLVFIRKGI